MLTDEADIVLEIAAGDDFKDNIRGALFKIEKAIGSSPTSSPPPTAPSTSSGVLAARKVKLPELSLSHFDGEPTKWYMFWDTFVTRFWKMGPMAARRKIELW